MRTTFVSLRAAYASIVNEGRGRLFSAEERQRIQGMIEEGYDARSFSDLIVDTDIAGFDEVLAALERDVRTFLER